MARFIPQVKCWTILSHVDYGDGISTSVAGVLLDGTKAVEYVEELIEEVEIKFSDKKWNIEFEILETMIVGE